MVDNPPSAIPITITYQVGKLDNGTCHVYVIYSTLNYGNVQVEKYGMTCRNDLKSEELSLENPRPRYQVSYLNKKPDPGRISYHYSWIVRNISKNKSLIVEKAMVAAYIIANNGVLPPLQKRPDFSRDLNKALEFLDGLK